MIKQTRITESYEPDDGLQEFLKNILNNSALEYTQKNKLSLANKISAEQLHYTVRFENHTVTGCDTISPLGIFSSLQGNQKMVAALILTFSLQYGEPTLTYEDSAKLAQHESDYNDVTAEWYHEPFVKKGLPESRMQNRPEIYETKDLSLKLLEKRAIRGSSLN